MRRQIEPAILDVTAWQALGFETLGKKRKQWLADAEGRRWLLKIPREDERLGRRGEDWSEWMASAIAGSLGFPAPEVRLALANQGPGVVIASFAVDDAELTHGSEVMAGAFDDYDRGLTGQHPDYSLTTVITALQKQPELRCDPAFSTAVDQWLAYIVFDAVIANTDRHHDNWGLLEVGQYRKMAPPFDHGTALGMQISDAQRRSLCDSEQVASWTSRGVSRPFAGRPALLDLGREALAQMSEAGRADLLARISELDLSEIEDAVEAAPKSVLSAPAGEFALEVVRVNRRRLLNASLGLS